jgi:hypothetical protein
MSRTRSRIWIAGVLFVAAALLFYRFGKPLWKPMADRATGRRTVESVLRGLGPAAEVRLAPHFAKAGVPFPPARLALLGFKAERRLEVWAGSVANDASPTESAPTRVGGHSVADGSSPTESAPTRVGGHFRLCGSAGEDRFGGQAVADGPWRHVRDYPVLAASGRPGPKLREGDCQVPEGLYRVERLNPQSRYHLSLRLDYPNAFDREQAAREGRTSLGGDIYIHGGAVSIGCLAMGDEAVEELFVLAARTGLPNIRVILAPADLRAAPGAAALPREPAWIGPLYAAITKALDAFR